MSYKIQILSDDDFEALPYEEASISLGLADTNIDTAYVRYVANQELQKYLIKHELEHLIGEDRDEIHHDGKGVYYKGFGNVFSGLGQSMGGALGNIGGAAQGFGQNIGRSLGGAASSIGGGISNLAGSLGQAMNFGGGFQGGKNPSGGMAAAAASNPALRAPANYFASAPSSSISPFSFANMGASMGGLNSSNPLRSQVPIMQSFKSGGGGFGGQGASGSFGQPSPSMGRSMTTPSIPVTAQVGQGQPSGQPTGGSTQPGSTNMLDTITQGFGAGQQIMSMFGGKGGGGGMGGGYPSGIQMPDISQLPSVQALKNFDFRGRLNELDPAMLDAVNRDFDRIDSSEEHDFRNRWKGVRPGADLENDSVFARDYAELKRSQGLRRADALAKYRMEMVTTNLGINEKEYGQLKDMASMDIDSIMTQFGLNYEEAMKLQQTFGFGQENLTRDEGGPLGAVGRMIQSGQQLFR